MRGMFHAPAECFTRARNGSRVRTSICMDTENTNKMCVRVCVLHVYFPQKRVRAVDVALCVCVCVCVCVQVYNSVHVRERERERERESVCVCACVCVRACAFTHVFSLEYRFLWRVQVPDTEVVFPAPGGHEVRVSRILTHPVHRAAFDLYLQKDSRE